MRENIHPDYHTVKVVCACGNTFETGSTKEGETLKIDICNKSGNSNEFIEFILLMLDEVLDGVILSSYKESRHISDQVNKLLSVMEPDIPYSAKDLLSLLNVKSKETLRASYLNPAIENGLIKMTLPDKPNSKNQKYVK